MSTFEPSSFTSFCLIQIKVKVVFELLLFSPVNSLLLLAFLGQAFFFSTWFCQSIWFLACKQDPTRKIFYALLQQNKKTHWMQYKMCSLQITILIIIFNNLPLSEGSGSSEGTGVPGCSGSWFSSAGVVEAALSGDAGFVEDAEYTGLLSNGLA